MRHIDLEMYRWRFHNDIYIHTTKKMRPDRLSLITWSSYWKEYGAFVSVLPRQSGKSKMIYTLANSITNGENGLSGDYVIVCAFSAAKREFTRLGLDNKKIYVANEVNYGTLVAGSHSNKHLMIDEFMYSDMENHLIHALNYDWKSVTMVSSLK